MKKILIFLLLLFPCLADAGEQWSTTWGTSPEYTGVGDMPKTVLAGKTLREVIQASGCGNKVRLRLTNFHSDSPVDIKAVYIAYAADSSDIIVPTAQYLTFNGDTSVTLPAHKNVVSDAVDFRFGYYQRLAITIVYGDRVPEHATSHRGSRTTSYIADGNIGPHDSFKTIEKADHWYNILSLEVEGPSPVVAVLGNSITDGRGSTTNKQNRWTDFMAKNLPLGTNVVNLGIGGNCVLEGGLSQPLLRRYRDELGFHAGISHLIIFEGTNDIGTSNAKPEVLAEKLVKAYKEIIEYAHSKGMKVYMATITPTKGNGWYSPSHEEARQKVNEWIRKSEGFDGLIDFDKLVRDGSDSQRLRADLSEDWLHLNPKGYEVMGKYAAGVVGRGL